MFLCVQNSNRYPRHVYTFWDPFHPLEKLRLTNKSIKLFVSSIRSRLLWNGNQVKARRPLCWVGLTTNWFITWISNGKSPRCHRDLREKEDTSLVIIDSFVSIKVMLICIVHLQGGREEDTRACARTRTRTHTVILNNCRVPVQALFSAYRLILFNETIV